MSCNICQIKFSFFTKENGCPNCGFSCCSKCLKYKYNLANIGQKKICGRCYNKLQMQVPETPTEDFLTLGEQNESFAPIDITKRMESLENPSKPPIVIYKHNNRLDNLRAGLDPIDHEIINRLMKLKENHRVIPLASEDEIRRRLAILKDQNPDIATQPVNFQQVDIRTDQQKSDDLIHEYLERLNISKSKDRTDSEIQARLDSLRGAHSSKCTTQNISDIEVDDDETAMKKIIEKAMAEAALDKKYGVEASEEDELQDVDSDIPLDMSNNNSDDSSPTNSD